MAHQPKTGSLSIFLLFPLSSPCWRGSAAANVTGEHTWNMLRHVFMPASPHLSRCNRGLIWLPGAYWLFQLVGFPVWCVSQCVSLTFCTIYSFYILVTQLVACHLIWQHKVVFLSYGPIWFDPSFYKFTLVIMEISWVIVCILMNTPYFKGSVWIYVI